MIGVDPCRENQAVSPSPAGQHDLEGTFAEADLRGFPVVDDRLIEQPIGRIHLPVQFLLLGDHLAAEGRLGGFGVAEQVGGRGGGLDQVGDLLAG